MPATDCRAARRVGFELRRGRGAMRKKNEKERKSFVGRDEKLAKFVVDRKEKEYTWSEEGGRTLTR